MIAYKLIRKLKDGSLSPLFINKKSRIPIGVWMNAEDFLTILEEEDILKTSFNNCQWMIVDTLNIKIL